MMICNHPDFDYKQACFDAYNLWIAEYCAAHPDRLVGIGQTAMRSVDDGIRDLRKIRELGLRGVMLPGNPAVADYHDPVYAPFYEAAIDLGLPLSFHILTSQQDTFKVRGPKLNAFMSIIRGCQDLVGTFVLGGVFERHPRLRLVCVEADAGWVPHFMYRMDLLWANDFPHSDSTWPRSQELLAKHASHLTPEELRLILHDNVAELYGLAGA